MLKTLVVTCAVIAIYHLFVMREIEKRVERLLEILWNCSRTQECILDRLEDLEDELFPDPPPPYHE